MSMCLRDLRPLLVIVIVATLSAALVTVGGASADLLAFAPALLLLVPLLMGRYVGERSLRRLSVRFADRRRRAADNAAPMAPRHPRRLAAAGGLLLAERLAGRAPPRALLTTR